MKINVLKYFAAAALVAAGCSDAVTAGPEFMDYASFEDDRVEMTFHAGNGSMIFEEVDNPKKEGLNTTDRCGHVISGGGENEFIWSEPFGRNFDFTANPPIFKMKVIAPKAGLRVWMKLEPVNITDDILPVEVKNVLTKTAGQWEELVFDFSEFAPRSNWYRKIVLMFDAGHTTIDQEWFFDEITGPSDDLTKISLFQRYEGNPVFYPEGTQNWRDSHIANASIISPADSPDGNWWMYVRGSGNVPDYHDQIGLFTQPADDFKPFGPWNEYKGNPVIPHGPEGSFDEWHLLDCAAVKGPDGTVYVYYKGRMKNDNGSMDPTSAIGVAYSKDGGYTFTKKDGPWKKPGGPSDAVYHDGKFYIFCGPWVHVTEDPLSYEKSTTYRILEMGDGPAEFDRASLWGSMVFRLEEIDKWFIAYQGMSIRNDFPDRFHVAYSDDLLHWTKVKNDQPLYGRGSAGEWDQGGMWCPEIIEHDGMLYLYYEGWGYKGHVKDRNAPYFGGNSSIGVAYASKEDFLRWCGLIN